MTESNGPQQWIADRMSQIESSGIRKVFELARSLKNPVNLSIGQPDFDVPEPIKAAAHAAIDRGDNGYTVTQGIKELCDKIQADVDKQYGHSDRQVFITSGTSGGLLLSLCCTVNPGDEVIVFDPYFVMYPHLIALAGGKTVFISTYPTFDLDLDKVRQAITSRTKAILVNSPANPTGHTLPREQLQGIAELAKERNIMLVSDEVYRTFSYDDEFCSPAEFNEDVLVVDGFSKSYGMTGWRLGFAHGPRVLVQKMLTLQQFSFVCAASIVQHGGVAAWDYDVSEIVRNYRGKRDRIVAGLRDHYDLVEPGGAFYLFPRAPWGTATEFVAKAIEENLLIIPGNVFSQQDTHFRLSYAADDATLDKGIEILRRISKR